MIEQLLNYKTLFFYIVTTIGYAISPAMNKSLHATLVKNFTSGGGPLFHSSYDSVVARKMLPTQSVFHRSEQMEVRRHQIRTVRWAWNDSPAKIYNVLHGLQTGMGPVLTSTVVSVNVHQTSMNGIGCNFFSAWMNSITHFCFIRTSMSDAILSDCSSADICRTTTKFNGILAGRFNLYRHITNIRLCPQGTT